MQNSFFADNCRPVSALLSLIPSSIVKLGMPPTDQFESWHDDLSTLRSLDNELARCFSMRSRQCDRADLPDTLMKSLVSADPDSFPNIIILLVLGCTLFATSAEAERSFSVLRLIKSHLRSWVVDTRFSALTLMKIHYRKDIDSKQITDRFDSPKTFVQGHPFRLTDIDLHEIINILNIIVSFS